MTRFAWGFSPPWGKTPPKSLGELIGRRTWQNKEDAEFVADIIGGKVVEAPGGYVIQPDTEDEDE